MMPPAQRTGKANATSASFDPTWKKKKIRHGKTVFTTSKWNGKKEKEATNLCSPQAWSSRVQSTPSQSQQEDTRHSTPPAQSPYHSVHETIIGWGNQHLLTYRDEVSRSQRQQFVRAIVDFPCDIEIKIFPGNGRQGDLVVAKRARGNEILSEKKNKILLFAFNLGKTGFYLSLGG